VAYRMDASELVRSFSQKRWRCGVAIKANPLRGGGAKPTGLLCIGGSRAVERRVWRGNKELRP
jgi:hypothetical protein